MIRRNEESVSLTLFHLQIVFSLVGAIVYAYTGNQYMTSPVRLS